MRRKIGSQYINGECKFTVWAPESSDVKVILVSKNNQVIPMKREDFGYWTAKTNNAACNDLYLYDLGNGQWPDPASNSQPKDVHGPSQIIDHQSFKWSDSSWKGLLLKEMIIYELHTGTFTPEGSFEAIITKIPHLNELGINAIEIMPVGQFSGDRNWGYDGVYPFAVQSSYGGPEGLKKLVDACHNAGIAVIIDAVYNHFGPEGSYHEKFGKYHTDKYSTPWGSAINFDDSHSDEVRNYFIQNALMWFRDYHIDGLRLDAIHACKDMGSLHFVKELALSVKDLESETGRLHILIGECDLNDPKYISPVSDGGYGLDGQWCDEFHYALRTVITEDTTGYYEDFGLLEHLRRAYQDTFVYTGQYSKHRKKTFGTYPEKNPYSQFVVFCQNHDQIGNRLLGDRISTLVSFEELKVMAGSVLISPSVPMLFMGEEFAEDAPFQYFISHTDMQLVNGIREGRKREFSYFNFKGDAPDPFAEETYTNSKLNWNFKESQQKATLFEFYKKLIQLRKNHAAFKNDDRHTVDVQMEEEKGLLKIFRHFESAEASDLYAAINYKNEDALFSIPEGSGWKLFLDSADVCLGGTGKSVIDSTQTGEAISIKGHSILIYTK